MLLARGLVLVPVQHGGTQGDEHPREYRSTQRSLLGRARSVRGDVFHGELLERDQVGGLVGQGWTSAKQRRCFGEVKCGFAFTAAFSAPSQEAGHESLRNQKGSFPRTGSQGHGEREHLVPVPISPTRRTPSSHPTHRAVRQEQTLCTSGWRKQSW